MGGCAVSRLGGSGEEEDPVALCRERKQLIKEAVDRRYGLAAAHASYIQSLNAVAAAIDIFVARLSAPTPFLITLPDSSAASKPIPALSPCSYLRQTPSEPKIESLPYHPSQPLSSPSSSSSGDDREAAGFVEEEEEEENRMGEETSCGYFYSATAPMPPPPPAEVFGWDFFNPFFEVHRAAEPVVMVGGLERSSDEYLRAVREQEGIPELEEAEEEEEVKDETPVEEDRKKMAALGVEAMPESGGGGKREEELALSETLGQGRELLQALREVEDHFIRAYHSGKEVSRMLECNMVQPQAAHEEMKENSSKVIRAITWHRSPSVSSSHMSLLASSSNSTSWTESASELSDDYVGMASGSHSQTLGRLYAWEKKLYEEVKAGDYTWQAYQKKCLQLRNKEAKETKSRSVDKTRASARELYARIGVAFRAAQSISERIQKLRDEELQPQILELIQGLMQTWKVMLESHESQKKIMFEVNTFTSPTYGKFCNDSHRLATVTLEAELRSWRSCFIGYVAAQRAYVEALDRWLSKFLVSDVEYYSRSRSLFPSHKAGTPPVVVISHEWLTTLRRLPDQSVSTSMRSFIRTVRGLWIKQGEEQQQKRKVHRLAKELNHRVLALQKAENKVLESKLSEDRPDSDMRQRVEYLSGRKELLEMFRKKLEAEKAKHRECMRKTHEITINGFKIGLASIFESLMQFSKDSVNFYGDLLMHDEKGKVVNEEIAQKTICREDLGQG
ncbi:hypothetical protein Cni_G03375 [Canna indica]|uniref:Nitrate regulatory gene2 protein-like n=1 Tax=Canna indica TaxID=4628 RepID=A0AAQ3JUG5_9LILI|nr:hypothetical protein Cni_G03375 [Canna indica]